MIHPKDYLFQKIIESNDDNLPSLQRLNAEHMNDLATVIQDFSLDFILEILKKLDTEKQISLGGISLVLDGELGWTKIEAPINIKV